SDGDLDTYLKAHEAEYRQPERRKVTYVTVPTRDFIKAPSDADVEKYYTEHAAEFEKPPQIRVAHVLVRVPETGGSEGEDKARAEGQGRRRARQAPQRTGFLRGGAPARSRTDGRHDPEARAGGRRRRRYDRAGDVRADGRRPVPAREDAGRVGHHQEPRNPAA